MQINAIKTPYSPNISQDKQFVAQYQTRERNSKESYLANEKIDSKEGLQLGHRKSSEQALSSRRGRSK